MSRVTGWNRGIKKVKSVYEYRSGEVISSWENHGVIKEKILSQYPSNESQELLVELYGSTDYPYEETEVSIYKEYEDGKPVYEARLFFPWDTKGDEIELFSGSSYERVKDKVVSFVEMVEDFSLADWNAVTNYQVPLHETQERYRSLPKNWRRKLKNKKL